MKNKLTRKQAAAAYTIAAKIVSRGNNGCCRAILIAGFRNLELTRNQRFVLERELAAFFYDPKANGGKPVFYYWWQQPNLFPCKHKERYAITPRIIALTIMAKLALEGKLNLK